MKAMKKLSTVIALTLVCALAIFCLSACRLQVNGPDTGDTGSGGSGGASAATEYTVTYNSDGGSAVASVKVAEGKRAEAPASPTKNGYVFAGWYNGDALWVFSENTVNANITLKAKWTALSNSQVVSFNSNGGSVVESQIIPASGKITAPQAPTKSGYNFLGWYNGDNAWNFATSVASGSITLTAKWELADYTVGYELGENALGAAENPTSYTILDEAIEIAAPTREGFNFIGWTYGDVTVPSLTVTVGGGKTGNILLTANWEIAPEFATYKINYNLDGGKNAEGNPATYTEGTERITLSAPTRSYYKFIGWTYDGVDTPAMSVSIDPMADTGDKTFTANWEAVTYTIKYVLSGGEHLGNPTSYTVNDLPLAIKPAVKAQTHFYGWYSDADYTAPVSTIATCSDITLYAKFIESTDGVVYTLNESGTGYVVTDYTGTAAHIYIAYKHNGLPVVEIADKAFFGLSLAGATIPEGVEKIGNLAFGNCQNLSTLELPSTIKYIGSDAFKNCPINSFTLDGGVYYVGNSTNPYAVAFKAAANIGSDIVLNANTKVIYSYALENASRATTLTLPDGLKMLCDYALAGLSSVTELSLPDSLEYIGSYVFHGCTSLQYTVEGGVRYLGNENNKYLAIVKAMTPAGGSVFTLTVTEDTKIICGYAFAGISAGNILFEADEDSIYIHAVGNDILFAESEPEE